MGRKSASCRARQIRASTDITSRRLVSMIIEFFGPAAAGKTTVAHALCKRLNERGHNADVVLSCRPGAEVSSVDPGGGMAALHRIVRGLVEITSMAARPIASKNQFDLTLKLVRALPPRSIVWFVRLSQYVLRLCRYWDLSKVSAEIVIFDQAFVQATCALALHNEHATDASLQQALKLVPKADLIIRVNAPPEMLEARLRERLRLESPAERIFEANIEKNLAAIPIVDRIDRLLRMHGESSISLSSVDQHSLCETLDKAEETILGWRDRNAGRDPIRSIPLRADTLIETCCALESGKSNAPTKPATRRLAKIKQSAEVLRKHGLLKCLELSILSLSEPVKSAHLRAAVAADARRTLIKIKGEGGGRGLFIDCGSNIGQGYKFFSKYYTPNFYDYILVEPNTNCVPHLQALRRDGGGRIEIVEKAASARDGHTKLFGPPAAQRDLTYEGCSIVIDHNNALYEAEEITVGLVETFSLSDLIMTKCAAYDVVVMKMDVEGAEYEILEDMIEKGMHRKLDAIYVEFHSQYMSGSERTDRRSVEKKIQNSFSAENIIFRRWI